MLQMRRSFSAATFTYVLVTLATAEQCLCAPGPHADSPPDFRELLQMIASFPPDPCGPPNGAVQNSSELESSAFDRAADIVTEGLNTARATPQSSVERATETLNKLVRMSAEVNSSWPEEDRFRFEILKLPPVIVVKMGLRNHELFFAFGNSEGKSGNANQIWHSSIPGLVSILCIAVRRNTRGFLPYLVTLDAQEVPALPTAPMSGIRRVTEISSRS